MKIKIATLGSCVTRDPFNTFFNPNYKDFYKLFANQFHTSLISMMSKPIEYDSMKFKYDENVKDFADWHFKSELNKQFLNDLVLNQPHYLIVDFYADIHFGVIEVGDSYLTNKEYAYKKNELWESLIRGKKFNVELNFSEYFEKFKKAIDEFYFFCKKYLENTIIIVNQARYTYEYWDNVNKKINIFGRKTPDEYSKLNDFWSKLDEYLLEKPGVKSITYDKKYYADPNYRYGGLDVVHFKNNFYEDFLKKLLAITFDDLINQNLKFNSSQQVGNFIQNSTFALGNSSWKFFNPQVFSVENKAVIANSHGNVKNMWNQVVSEAISIVESSDFYFSFKFEEIDMSDMDDLDSVVVIRTFKKRNVFKEKDSTEQIEISKAEVLEQLGRNESNRFIKNIHLDSGYIKVIPYLKKNGSYRIKELQLSTTNSNYQVALNEQLH